LERSVLLFGIEGGSGIDRWMKNKIEEIDR